VTSGTEASYRERILRVRLHIEAHLDEPASVEGLATVSGFSPYHFHRIFRALVGESVMEHVRRLRLERAAQRLKAAGGPRVIDVALEAGYETHEAFTRAFRAMFGAAPSAYRRARRRPPPRRPPPAAPHGAAALPVRLERLGAIRAAFLRHVGPYECVGPTFDRLLDWARHRGLLVDPATLVFGLSLDDPDVTAPERLRYDACVAVPGHLRGDGEVGIHEIPAREYAAVTYTGPYEELDGVYRWLCGEWPPGSGREVAPAPCLEIYRNDPAVTPAAELVTDVFLPLEPAWPSRRP
jgi:AraC family transcriptional regulator